MFRPSTATLARTLVEMGQEHLDKDFVVFRDHGKHFWHTMLMRIFRKESLALKAEGFCKESMTRWPTPTAYLQDNQHARYMRKIGLAKSTPCVTAFARALSRGENDLHGMKSQNPGICRHGSKSTVAVEGASLRLPVREAAVRVAQRIFSRVL